MAELRNNKIILTLLPTTKATVCCSIYDRNHRYAWDLRTGNESPFYCTLLVHIDAYECDTSTTVVAKRVEVALLRRGWEVIGHDEC